MKKILLSTFAAISVCSIIAQTPAYGVLDINQVKASAQSNGDLFWNANSFAEFNVPADSITSTIFAGSLWIGGLDPANVLHLGAQTYRQSGDDFFQGPMQDPLHYTMQSNAIWNRVWKINKTSVDSLILWQMNPAQYPNYSMPYDILTWPGNGDVSKGQAAQLAPFTDVNGDGIYDPNSGDYPCIKGDQCLYFIFNDHRDFHTESGGNIMGVEVHAMMYAYSTPGSALDSTIFLNYRLYNRSPHTYHNVYCGQWTDFDIGDAFDDYVGSSVERSLYYGYNGDSTDMAYGVHPPAQGVLFLNGPLADANDGIDNDRDGTVDEPGETCTIWQFMAYDNNFSATGNPATPFEYYNYLGAYWKDGSPLTYGGSGYGGTDVCGMMYPGSSDPFGWDGNFVPRPAWDEISAGNPPNDRRGIGSSGPFTLEAGSSECITYAYVFARGTGNHLSSINAMFVASDAARSRFLQDDPCNCGPVVTGIQQSQSSTVSIYPNPSTDHINIFCGDNSTGAQIEIMDASGRLVHTSTVLSGNSAVIEVTDLPAGIYLVRVNKGSVVLTGKFVRN